MVTSIPFVGRERGLAGLVAALEAARAGDLALVSVVGEPGIGKTTLVEHFAAEVSVSDATIHRGRCWEDQDAPPLWPWTQLLRSVAEEMVDAPDVQRLTESGDAAAPESGRFGQFDAIGDFLANASDTTPLVLVLVLDDLQWADQGGLDIDEADIAAKVVYGERFDRDGNGTFGEEGASKRNTLVNFNLDASGIDEFFEMAVADAATRTKAPSFCFELFGEEFGDC